MNAQTNTSEYMLLFSGNEWYNALSHEELQKVMSHCKTWFDGLAEQGRVKAGSPLGRSGTVVSGKSGRTVADGPFAESKEAIGGYLLLQAASHAEAVAIAKSNPTLAYGTTIEVRPVIAECPMNVRARQLSHGEQLVTA